MPEKYNDQVVDSLKPGLHEANTWFRERNKEIILKILNSPLQSTPEVDTKRLTDVYGTIITRMLLAGFAPGYTQDTYNAGEIYLVKPEHEKRVTLHTSAWILDQLTHSQRLIYLKDAMMTDVQKANDKWLKQVKVKPVVKGELVQKGTKI